MNNSQNIDFNKIFKDCNIKWKYVKDNADNNKVLYKGDIEKIISYFVSNNLKNKNIQINDSVGDFVISDVFRCSRCTKDHLQLKFKKFTNDYMYVGVKKFEYWSICPETSEPILLHLQYSVE